MNGRHACGLAVSPTMKQFPSTILLLIILSVSMSVVGQKRDDTDGVILLGRNFSFTLKEPAGWVLDSEIGKSEGVQAVVYPAGSSWKNSVTVMYARVIYKDETQPTIEKVISEDITEFMKLSKESTVADAPSIETRDKRKGIAKVFYDAANKNYECVTFIDGPRVVVIIALSSRDKNEYEKALPAFKALVSSYFFFAPLAGHPSSNVKAGPDN